MTDYHDHEDDDYENTYAIPCETVCASELRAGDVLANPFAPVPTVALVVDVRHSRVGTTCWLMSASAAPICATLLPHDEHGDMAPLVYDDTEPIFLPTGGHVARVLVDWSVTP